jgi:hypothetical protein
MRHRDICSVELILTILLLAGGVFPAEADETQGGFWGPKEVETVLDKTLEIRLDPDLTSLTPAERATLDDLLVVGEIMHRLYLDQRHPESLAALEDLERLVEAGDAELPAARLLDLYRIFKGPIATTVENERIPFVPVSPERPGKNVYPEDVEREDLRAFFDGKPDLRQRILDVRSVIRRATAASVEHHLAILSRHPVLDVLHPGLRDELETLARTSDASLLYAVPYSVAWADDLLEAYRLLRRAAATIRPSDEDFAAYLDNRALDFLTDNYEAGDASWVRGRFGVLNAQIGSYETYDDSLFGVKSFFSAGILLRDEERSRVLTGAIRNLQAFEDSLPYDGEKTVDSDIPVGVYNVIADFGQARGTNTASILPNESDHARKYGRTILLRYNIMTHPELFANTRSAWQAAVALVHANDLTLDGGFNRTLWHEVGHYLGPATTKTGEALGVALAEHSDLIEELKSDLVSLYVAPSLLAGGYYDEVGVRSVYADGIRRTLQRVRPRPSQPYQTMQLMQMNYFLDRGLLEWSEDGLLVIDYSKYEETVSAMLEEVLALQWSGDEKRAAEFIEKWAVWDEATQGALGRRIGAASKYRYRLVRYAALGE